MAELEKTPVSIFKTRTFYGILLAVIALFLPKYGRLLTDENTIDLIQQGVGLVGAGLALYGRLYAQRTASISPPAAPPIPPATEPKDEIGAPALPAESEPKP